MKKHISQYIMVWFLPLITIGGFFIPLLGYFVFAMMVFFLVLAYFKGRLWCSRLCPRGAFLDLVLSKISFNGKLPSWLVTPVFRWVFFSVFMVFFITQLMRAPKTVFAIGFVFVRMCLVTTLIAIFAGIPLKARTWCAVCPMGTLQTKIGSLRKKRIAL